MKAALGPRERFAILFFVVALVVGAVVAFALGFVPVDPGAVTVGLPAILTAALALVLLVVSVVLAAEEAWKEWYRTLSPAVGVGVAAVLPALAVADMLVATALASPSVGVPAAVLSGVAVLPATAVLGGRARRQRRLPDALDRTATAGLMGVAAACVVVAVDLLGAGVPNTAAALACLGVWGLALIARRRRTRGPPALRQAARIAPVTVAVLGAVPVGVVSGVVLSETLFRMVGVGMVWWLSSALAAAWVLARGRRRDLRTDLRVVDRTDSEEGPSLLTVENTGTDPVTLSATRVEDAAGYHYRLDGDDSVVAGGHCVLTVPDAFELRSDDTNVDLLLGYRLGRDRSGPVAYSPDGTGHVLDGVSSDSDDRTPRPPVRRT